MDAMHFHPRILTCWETLRSDIRKLVGDMIVCRGNDFLATPDYRLFYYIREDMDLMFYLFRRTDPQNDPMIYLGIERSTRHAMEAYVDLFNLFMGGQDYLEYLKYTESSRHPERKTENAERQNGEAIINKYLKGRCRSPVSFQAKMIFFQLYLTLWNRSFREHEISGAWWVIDRNFMEDHLYGAFRRCSRYSHPDLFAPTFGPEENFQKHKESARILLTENMTYYQKAVYIFYRKFSGDAGRSGMEADLYAAEQSFQSIRPWMEGCAPIFLQEENSI